MDEESSKMIHEPLDSNSRKIRLLQVERPLKDAVHCTLSVFELAEAPPFKALSYTWGEPAPLHRIHIDGQSFDVRQNLWDFFVMTAEYDTWLWIDAICIDQTSNRERNHQVAFMDAIYKAADEVLIWLGQEADHSTLAMQFIDSWYIEYPTFASWAHYWAQAGARFAKSRPNSPDLDAKFGAIEALLQRPYWSRVWVIQEIIHGRHLVVLCGLSRLQWTVLSGFVILYCRPTTNYLIPNLRPEAIASAMSIFRRKLIPILPGPITHILGDFEHSHSSDVRDQVFALLSIVREEHRVQVDYDTSPGRLYFNVLRKAAEDPCWFDEDGKRIMGFAMTLKRKLKMVKLQTSMITLFLDHTLDRERKRRKLLYGYPLKRQSD
jgi:hypothetical protein